MSSLRKKLVALLIVPALLALTPAPASPGIGARLDGRLVGVDGRSASGLTMHLIDAQGVDLATSTTDHDGIYGFGGIEAGRYALGVETPAGLTPVAGSSILLASNELARRDVKLMGAELGDHERATHGNFGLGMWWAGLSTAAKVWTVVGSVVIVGITLAALSDSESEASPF